MNLIGMAEGQVSPGLMREALMKRFDSVPVWELSPDGQFGLACFDAADRLRLVVRFFWLASGWNYTILTPKRAGLPRQYWQ